MNDCNGHYAERRDWGLLLSLASCFRFARPRAPRLRSVPARRNPPCSASDLIGAVPAVRVQGSEPCGTPTQRP